MNANQWLRFTLLLFLSFPAVSQSTAAPRASAVRYRLPEGHTNLYSVQIEMRGEHGNEMLAGNLFVTSRIVASNVFSLKVRGTLSPKRDTVTMRAPMMYGSSSGPRWMMPVSLNEGAEIQFDESGRVLRVSGDYPLPIPLGTLAQAFVEPLPVKAENRWEVSEQLAVLDDPHSLGPAASFLSTQPYGMPYYGMAYYGGPPGSRANAPAIVSVSRKVRYEIKSRTAGQVTIAKNLGLDSNLPSGSEPRISASGEGQFVLDPETGLLRQAELQCKSVSNTETVTRRSTVTLRVTLLEGAEREAALQAQVPKPTTRPTSKLTDEDIQKILGDLKADDPGIRTSAAAKLQGADLSEASPASLEGIAGYVDTQDTLLGSAAVRIIADYGTQEHVPILLRLLKDSDQFSRNYVVRGLGRLKDKRAIEPLAALLASGSSDAHQAGEALSKFGAEAEDAVLAVLDQKHVETRRQACKVLKQIGTKKSVEPLRELMLSTDRLLSDAAGEAVRAIMARN